MIKAECITASKCQTKIATFKVTMPRSILAEAKTHRIISKSEEVEILSLPGIGFNDDPFLSKNSASSRAIPTSKMLKSVQDNPFIPLAWQKEHRGMQGTEYLDEKGITIANGLWAVASAQAGETVSKLTNPIYGIQATKQLANRLLEPFMYHTVLVTATEWDNFFELRCPKYVGANDTENENIVSYTAKSWKEFCSLQRNPHIREQYEKFDTLNRLKLNRGQADIHMMAVAEAIYDAWNEADFKELQPGEWHMPFGDQIDEGILYGLYHGRKIGDEIYFSSIQEMKKMISIARCARLSYQTLGDELKIDYLSDLKLYNNLKQSGHWSPFEHVAYAMGHHDWSNCVKTIINSNGHFENQLGWLANFRGWIQQRAILENA